MNESIRALLDRVVAEAPPPAPVDLDRVIGLAAAQQRRHVRWVVAAAAALVLVVTLAVTTLMTGPFSDRAAPVRPAGQPVNQPPVGTTPREAPSAFDVTHSSLVVDGVPDLTESGTSYRPDYLVFYAAGGKSMVQVFVSAKNVAPLGDPEGARAKTLTAGPAIQGHSSQWGKNEVGDTVLTWLWAPGAHAYVITRGISNAQKVMTGIANSLTVDLASPTRLPFSVKAPKGFTLKQFQTTVGHGSSPSAALAFGGVASSFISVNANLLGNGIGKATSTYQDRPVHVDQEAGAGSTVVNVVIAAGNLKVAGQCAYHTTPTISFADFKTLCIATTGSVQQLADLTKPGTWPKFALK